MQETITEKDKFFSFARNSKTLNQSSFWGISKHANHKKFPANQSEVRAKSTFGGIPNIDSLGGGMKKPITKTAPKRTKARSRAKVSSAALATCPVNGAGWCPYPFSVAQLEKRMKAKAQNTETPVSTK